jgi:hypothetical protein
MQTIWDSNNQQATIYVNINCKKETTFRVYACDGLQPNSFYADRIFTAKPGGARIFMSFPITPLKMVLGCIDNNNKSNEDFEISLEQRPLRKYTCWFTQEESDFIQLAENFSAICGYKMPPLDGKLYSYAGFNIKYSPVILDRGKVINTPARVGHKSGLIEVSAKSFKRYTIPMRMMILLHEFSHKFQNPNNGFEIGNEFGADLFGLRLYLSLGYSKIDAICVFNKVFLTADTKQNDLRSRKINDYIDRFEREEFAKRIN